MAFSATSSDGNCSRPLSLATEATPWQTPVEDFDELQDEDKPLPVSSKSMIVNSLLQIVNSIRQIDEFPSFMFVTLPKKTFLVGDLSLRRSCVETLLLKHEYDYTLNEEFLTEISVLLANDWKRLGRTLGINACNLERIDSDYDGLDEKAYQVMLRLQLQNGFNATRQALADAFTRIGRQDLVKYLGDFPGRLCREFPLELRTGKKLGLNTSFKEIEYYTVIKTILAETEEHYEALKYFFSHLIINCFDGIQVHSVEGNKFTMIVCYPVAALVTFLFTVSPAYIIVQELVDSTHSDGSIAKAAMDAFENARSKFTEEITKRTGSKSKMEHSTRYRASEKQPWLTTRPLMLQADGRALVCLQSCFKLNQWKGKQLKKFSGKTTPNILKHVEGSSDEGEKTRSPPICQKDNDKPKRTGLKETKVGLKSQLLNKECNVNSNFVNIETQTSNVYEDNESRIISLTDDNDGLKRHLKEAVDELRRSKIIFENEKTKLLEKIDQLGKKLEESRVKNDFLQQQLETREDAIKQIGRDLHEKEEFIKKKKSDEEWALVMGKMSVSTQTPSLEGWASATNPGNDEEMGATATTSQAGATAFAPEIQSRATTSQPGATALEPERKITSGPKIKATPVTSNMKASASGSDINETTTDMGSTSTACRIGATALESERKIIPGPKIKATPVTCNIKTSALARDMKETALGMGSTSTPSQIGTTALDPDVKATACQLGVTALKPERKISPCYKVKATPVTSNIKASGPDGKSSTTDFQVKATSLAPDMRETTTASLIGTSLAPDTASQLGAASLAPDTRKTDETAPFGRSTEQNVSILQESGVNDTISLTNEPTTAVERSVFNHYKLLLLMITHRLLLSDVIKFKEWARMEFQINGLHDVWDILLKLDERKIITAMNLEKLREFFFDILRIDLVYLIDCFKIGDYTYLNDTTTSLTGAPRNRVTSPRVVNEARPREGRTRASDTTQGAPAVRTTAVSADGTQQTARMLTVRAPTVAIECSQDEQGASANTDTQTPQGDLGSNGQKLSKFQRRDDDDDDDDSNTRWLCSHYKRKCRVKFSCCNEYWPCHRCHNHESNCVQKKLKSRDTKFVKCDACQTEQPFTERSQYCTNCNMKFAKYFCAICKHLTGTDDNPYHCEQCGICRIHRDRSFHCDVCGVCLDVQLRGNHKCRAGSAHDECCICLEDAFTGCQILPCSHKVHKECATQMIRNGITRCPICRESFKHKLEKRPMQGPKKRDGKK